jgi:hypothetical protein
MWRADHTAHLGDMRNAAVVTGLNVSYRYICEDDIKMDLKRIRVVGCGMYSFVSGEEDIVG